MHAGEVPRQVNTSRRRVGNGLDHAGDPAGRCRGKVPVIQNQHRIRPRTDIEIAAAAEFEPELASGFVLRIVVHGNEQRVRRITRPRPVPDRQA